MSIILKPLFDVLTGDVAVMDNVLYNYVIMLAVGEVAFRLAWNFVGGLYRAGVIDGKAAGSIIHWIIRIIAYVICAYVIRGGIWIYNLVVSVPPWVWWTLLGVVVSSVIGVITVKLLKNRKSKIQEATKDVVADQTNI